MRIISRAPRARCCLTVCTHSLYQCRCEYISCIHAGVHKVKLWFYLHLDFFSLLLNMHCKDAQTCVRYGVVLMVVLNSELIWELKQICFEDEWNWPCAKWLKILLVAELLQFNQCRLNYDWTAGRTGEFWAIIGKWKLSLFGLIWILASWSWWQYEAIRDIILIHKDLLHWWTDTQSYSKPLSKQISDPKIN